MRDLILSEPLIEVARRSGATLDLMIDDEWAAIRLALVASDLREALKQERGKAKSVEAGLLLDGAIARCESAVARPGRARQELAKLLSEMLGTDRPETRIGPPRFRVIQGGLSVDALT